MDSFGGMWDKNESGCGISAGCGMKILQWKRDTDRWWDMGIIIYNNDNNNNNNNNNNYVLNIALFNMKMIKSALHE